MAQDGTQRIARLTPLAEVLDRIDRLVEPVAPREIRMAAALGRVLAVDVIVPPRPTRALALRDGWATQSDLTADAGAYAPIPLPMAHRIDAGEPLPAGADAVAPLDAVELRGATAAIAAPLAPGEGVLAAGADAAGAVFLSTGSYLTRIRISALAAAEVGRVMIREPRVRVACVHAGPDPIIDAAAVFTARAIAAEGGVALIDAAAADTAPLADALREEDTDAIVAIGGTGSGRKDASVRTLASRDGLQVHGIALSPGETAAFGAIGARPVLLLPGRLDAALAAWLVLGARMLRRLAASNEEPPAVNVALARKVASSLGMAEVIPVRRNAGGAEPLAQGYWPLHAIAQADGWILVPPEREGYAAGTEVMVRPWP
jgi:molybdopterin biosynthesis enzyme